MAGLSARAALIDQVAGGLLVRTALHPLRIGIDGRTAAGRTELADVLSKVVRASVGDFHLPADVPELAELWLSRST